MKIVEVDLGEHMEVQRVRFDGEFEAFPRFIRFAGKRYEMVMHETSTTGVVDWKLFYGEIPAFDPAYWNDGVNLEDLLHIPKSFCECGAKYTSFPNTHMFYCSLWRHQ